VEQRDGTRWMNDTPLSFMARQKSTTRSL